MASCADALLRSKVTCHISPGEASLRKLTSSALYLGNELRNYHAWELGILQRRRHHPIELINLRFYVGLIC